MDEKKGEERTDRLRRAGADSSPELARSAETRSGHWDGDARPLRNVLKRNRKYHEETEARPIRGEGRSYGQSLRKAMDEEDEKDECRA